MFLQKTTFTSLFFGFPFGSRLILGLSSLTNEWFLLKVSISLTVDDFFIGSRFKGCILNATDLSIYGAFKV